MRVRRNDGQPVVTPSAVVAAATTAEKQENPLIEDNGETNQDAQRINTMRAQAVNKHAVNEPNAQAKSSTNQTSTQVFASSVVLVGGAVIIAIVAMAFKHTQKINTKRDENNPMQQSLLCHDMDYAAM
ncbi:hypothetical protein Poli38472_008649 [Pythium oligandrum]|uniref:Uncharacterized protein n=1 Tax=Pythium oligandrum TaxID=41045 RepID=A0A8K1C3U1_PYTOL|nr:hypothetical protein Poli38472_008649 [Pythium oligandrum]|eukprot:TMW56001.1 hypothetical protein Poli38472_008649 [Pythium oligandrum]